MKLVIVFAAFALVLIPGCACKTVSVKMPQSLHQPASEVHVTRGKEETWRAPVTVENIQGFSDELYGDLRRNFLDPLASGPYRYAIDSITLAAVPEAEHEWTLLLALDDGAAVRVENFVEWDAARESYFTSGYKRARAGLDDVMRKDPALRRYIASVTKPKTPSKREQVLVARAESQDSEARLAD